MVSIRMVIAATLAGLALQGATLAIAVSPATALPPTDPSRAPPVPVVALSHRAVTIAGEKKPASQAAVIRPSVAAWRRSPGRRQPGEATAAIAAPDDLATWLRTRAVPAGAAAAPPRGAEAAALSKLVAGARIVAIGEPVHGAHQPLMERNRLIRYLVEHHGFTGVGLESGFAEGQRIQAYVAGGPGDVVAIAHDNLNWTFGDLTGNIELLQWLRAWNAAHPAAPVRYYGADISGGDDKSEVSRGRIALDDIAAFLAATVPGSSAGLRKRLAGFSPRFGNAAYAAYTRSERASLDAAVVEVERFLTDSRAAMVAASSEAAYAIAAEEMRDIRALVQVFKLWPLPGTNQMPGMIALSTVRDRAMADHLLWALEREGPRGRIVTFAANGHVQATLFDASERVPGSKPTPGMGTNLRAALGTSLRILMLTPQPGGVVKADAPQGSVNQAFAAAGLKRALVDLRSVPADSAWRRPQTLSAHYGTLLKVVPADAADAVMQIDALTCEPTTRPMANDCPR